jgi:pilus assembly protein Flp/PilA
MKLFNHVRSFVRNEEGQDLIEYAMLVALIALLCIGAVTAAGGNVKSIFEAVANQIVLPT